MKITIETIPHDKQRYPTVGDWFFTKDVERPHETEMGPGSLWIPTENLTIRVSDMGDWRYNALVGLHELVEVLKCKHDGVSQESVDQFDIEFEKNRAKGDDSEPGDSPDAPYKKQHCLATGIERIMAAELGVDWKAYDDAVMSLP